jgi:hypothetical protein
LVPRGSLAYGKPYGPESADSRKHNSVAKSGYITLNTNKTKQNKQLEVHGDYTSIANCRKKFPLIFRVIFGMLRGQLKISTYLSHSFSRHSGWETTKCTLEE